MKKFILFLTALFTTMNVLGQPMQIEIQLANSQEKITASLADNQTARDFYAQLPLTMKLEDYASSEKICSDIPKRLSTADSPQGYAGKQGDLTYYAPWGNLAIFYTDSHVGYANGLVYFGKLTSGLDALRKIDGEIITIKRAE
ncbi:cyclophilin-like fold protein [Actinobacillus equuli]|uniref:cyclophilin-like fold protein n=1 Tax=Actinobacillus equuli TaxID=718 RepID=UPI0024425663|nr:cyclophilin-like fold protein [Actinobacillus equuli]WGE53498.1 cyclophilin-like fold protein [Actinobacillus equuli subsp. haemolyticus]WGE73933.1 cyclophilin-like fold protein [Actinobacillus equuli subsp. haemolyticus]